MTTVKDLWRLGLKEEALWNNEFHVSRAAKYVQEIRDGGRPTTVGGKRDI